MGGTAASGPVCTGGTVCTFPSHACSADNVVLGSARGASATVLPVMILDVFTFEQPLRRLYPLHSQFSGYWMTVLISSIDLSAWYGCLAVASFWYRRPVALLCT